jgi:MFS family permease
MSNFSAYLLAAASLAPMYGKLSDITGRKPILYSGIVIFLVRRCRDLISDINRLTPP